VILDPVLKTIPLPFGAEVRLGGSGDVIAQIGFKLTVPVIEAFGCYSSSSIWTFHKHENQQLVGHLIHTRSDVSQLEVDATVSAIYGGLFGTRASERKKVRLQPVRLKVDD